MTTHPTLSIAHGLDLPLDAVTSTFAFLAIRGAGKTYATAVFAEELIGKGLRTVIVDPVGVTWGLRSSASGKGPGLPVVIFGGEHGDLALEEDMGAAIADVAVDATFSIILDLSLLSDGACVRFLTAFAERLYSKNRKPLHLILDEADDYAPQKCYKPGAERLLGAIQNIVRRGRARGLGVSLITQRSAVLNKSVLSQVETLVALRTISSHDRAAIESWIEAHGTQAERDTVMSSLATLENGEAWVWSPAWLKILKRVKIRRRTTFDSSATPKVGEQRIEPTAHATIDLDAIKGRIAEVVKRAAEDDPKRLKLRVATLERDLAAAKKVAPAVDPKLLDEARNAATCEFATRAALLCEDLQASLSTGFAASRKSMDAAIDDVVNKLLELASGDSKDHRVGPLTDMTLRSAQPVGRRSGARNGAVMVDEQAIVPSKVFARGGAQVGFSTVEVERPMQRILDALAWLLAAGVDGPWPREQVASVAGYSARSGGYRNTLSKLATAGLIEYPATGEVCFTDKGYALAKSPTAATTPAELERRVMERISAPERRVLEPILRAYPNALVRDDVATAAGYEPSSGGFRNLLSRLSVLGVVHYPKPGAVAASAWMFLE